MTDAERRAAQIERRNRRRAERGRDRSADAVAAKRAERQSRDRWLADAKAALRDRWQR